MIIRKAEEKDIEALTEIYNYEVIHGVSTLDLNPRTVEERLVWLHEHNRENHPLIVAEKDGIVAGYASLSSYREKEAYRSSVELSIYIHPDYRRQGIASALMSTLIDMAQKDPDTHLVVSVITAGNAASVRLHEKFGFTFDGTVHEVGVKFGKYQDIENYEKIV